MPEVVAKEKLSQTSSSQQKKVNNILGREILKGENKRFLKNIKTNPIIIFPNKKSFSTFNKTEIQTGTPFVVFDEDIYDRKLKRG